MITVRPEVRGRRPERRHDRLASKIMGRNVEIWPRGHVCGPALRET